MKQGGREGTRRTGKGHTGVSAGTSSSRRTASKSMRDVAALLLPFLPAFPPRESSAAAAAAAAAFAPGTRGRTASAACTCQTL